MKKCILAGLVALAAFTVTTESASAGPLLNRWRNRNHSTYICVRPYNAFTPVAHGRIHATGVCPVTLTPPSYFPPPYAPSCFAGPALGPMYAPFCGQEGDCHGAPIFVPGDPTPHGPTFTPPAPTPINPSSFQWPGHYGYGVIRTSAYQPNYYGAYPQYYPPQNLSASPWMGCTVPNYWYGAR